MLKSDVVMHIIFNKDNALPLKVIERKQEIHQKE